MATVADDAMKLRDEDVRQLWNLAGLLAQQQLTAQTAQCLEPLCAIDSSIRSAEEQEILLQANVLLAEIISVACGNAKKADDRDLWARRVIRVEKCIHAADSAMTRGVPCSAENGLRLLKAKFLLQQQIKTERTAKNRRMLEILCDALKCCSDVDGKVDAELLADFKQYFSLKLKACLVKMHAATVMARHAQDNSGINSFANNLKYLRSALPNYVDKDFLFWLVEVTCHTAISSFEPGDTSDMRQMVQFGQEFSEKAAAEQEVSADFRIYHLIITGFYYLRIGKLMKVSPLLDEIKALSQGAVDIGDEGKASGILKESYLNTIVDSLRLSVLACADPAQALTLAMETIHAAQTNLQTYAQYPAVRLMLLATLFDVLHVYCSLLGQQCRCAEMGASIAQMTTLFVAHKAELERTIFYRFFLARCHALIAKYAVAVGKVKDACAHLNYVVDKVLPTPDLQEASYPDAYLAVWVEVLEAAMYCCGIATQQVAASTGENGAVQVTQIYPSKLMLEWAARLLTMDGLRHHIYHCCSVELRAKYDLALAKWLWATDGLSEHSTPQLTPHAELEGLRPRLFTLLHESLQRMNTSMNSCETTAEIMALLGPQLVRFGKAERGEETLTNGIRISLHSKNVLLQTRLLVDIFGLYGSKGLVQAQATTAAKYEKKLALLRRRIAAAQAEQATAAVLLRWTASGK